MPLRDSAILRIVTQNSGLLVPQELAVQQLAAQLNIPASEILVTAVEPVQWQNTCLEISTNTTCEAQVIPGFRIWLEAQGNSFEFHTNQDASLIYGNSSSLISGQPLMIWERGAQACMNVSFFDQMVSVAPCQGEPYDLGQLSATRLGELLTMVTTYTSFLKRPVIAPFIYMVWAA